MNFIEVTLEEWGTRTLVQVSSIQRISESSRTGVGCMLHLMGNPPMELQNDYAEVTLQILAATSPPPTNQPPAGEMWAPTATEIQPAIKPEKSNE